MTLLPPDDILQGAELPGREKWQLVPLQGKISFTWEAEGRFVLQARPLARKKRWRYSQEVLAPLFFQPLFRAAHMPLLFEDRDVFWTYSGFVPGRPLQAEAMQDGMAWKRIQELAPFLLLSARGLQELSVPSYDGIESSILRQAFLLPAPAIKKRFLQAFPEADLSLLPPEPKSEEAICHSDFHPYNILFASRAVAVDWEGASPLPRHTDLAYFAAAFLRWQDPEAWSRYIDGFADLGFADEVHLSGREWRAAVLWTMMRALVAYKQVYRHEGGVKLLAYLGC